MLDANLDIKTKTQPEHSPSLVAPVSPLNGFSFSATVREFLLDPTNTSQEKKGLALGELVCWVQNASAVDKAQIAPYLEAALTLNA